MTLVPLLGLTGGLSFALAGVPTAWRTARQGKALAPVSIALYCIVGSIATYTYLYLTYGFNALLTLNYSVEFASWAVIAWYHYFPRA